MWRPEQISYLLRESVAGFHRRKLTTGVTVLIMGSALLVLAIFSIVTLNLGALLAKAHRGIDLRVFLQEELHADARTDLQLRLLAIDGVQSALYISKEQALGDFRAGLGGDAEVLDLLEENPLPASFHVTLKPENRNSALMQAVADQVAEWPQVAEIVFGRAWVELLERWNFLFRMASLIVGLVVFLAAVFVISNTVKLTVASSARVIEVMKLVGATNSFIRTPYLCEGMLEGFLGGALAMGILVVAHELLRPHMHQMVFLTPMQMVGFITLCVALGLVGSYTALRKYLKL